MTNTSNLPIESLEREYPLLVERYELRPDSAGPGRFRGGLGAVRVVAPAVSVAAQDPAVSDQRIPTKTVVGAGERARVTGADGAAESGVRGSSSLPTLVVGGWGCDQNRPPRGLADGADGQPGVFEVIEADGTPATVVRATVSGLQLRGNQKLRISTAGGGGVGDPYTRDPDRVLMDVREGRVTPAHATAAYGVVIRDNAVDQVATERLRASGRPGRRLDAPATSEPTGGTA